MAYLPHFDSPTVFCDSTVFSDINSSSSTLSSIMSTNLSSPMSRRIQEKTAASNLKAGAQSGAIYPIIFPVLPAAHNFSALGNPEKFDAYIKSQFPVVRKVGENTGGSGGQSLASLPNRPVPTNRNTCQENSLFFNNILKSKQKIEVGTFDWVNKTIFPNDKLPISFNDGAITADPTLWNEPTVSLPSPPKEMTERHVRKWLNNLAHNLSAVHNIPKLTCARSDRSFDSSTATKGPVGSFMLRKPDISVIDRTDKHHMKHSEEQMHWRRIFAIIEVTSTKPTPSVVTSLLHQIAEKSACLFDVQPQRRFTCALIFFGKPGSLKFVFVVVDRCSLIHTLPSPLTSTNVFTFLKIIFAFCFALPECLGWDPTMKINPLTKEVTSITVTGYESGSTDLATRTFTIVRLLHSSPVLYSRGTRVWIVMDEQGSFYVLKDSWILGDRKTSEIEFVKHIDQTIKDDEEGYLYQYICPTYCIGQETVWCTDTIRLHILKSSTRNQRRMVTGPIGDPITSFRSKKEFVTAFLDIINGMSFLICRRCIG